jgi:hypothetical protein
MYHMPGCAGQNTCCDDAMLPAGEDRFATEPAIASQTIYHLLDEETLHTFFEQAISDRLEAVGERLRVWSSSPSNGSPEATVRHISRQEGDLSVVPSGRHSGGTYWSWLNHAWQRRVIFASLALMLVLAGFDLMGVLVLRLH